MLRPQREAQHASRGGDRHLSLRFSQGRERLRVREFISNISKDLPFKRHLFHSRERSGSRDRRSKNKPQQEKAPLPNKNVSYNWKVPSLRTRKVVEEMFSKLFTEENEINGNFIDKTITLCPPDEDILLIEDRDHYNLLHKAIIFADLSLVTVLINHGCDVNGVRSSEECSISGKTSGKKCCPHDNLGSLHLACYLGHTEIVLLLLQRGADKSMARRVYTSAVINDPLRLQPEMMNSSALSRADEIISKCGRREPIFYAALGDHLDIVKILLAEQPHPLARPDPQYRYLVHLACRVGAFKCLRLLMDIYPEEINTKDSDGLPMLLMALNHDLKFVTMLLDHGADIHSLNDMWEPGSNILHLLYQGLPIDGANDTNRISHVTEVCLQRGVDVNSQRNPFNRIPLQDLLSVINIPVVYDPYMNIVAPSVTPDGPLTNSEQTAEDSLSQDALEEQSRFDDELYKCVKLLLKYGSNVYLKDDNNKSPLQILLSNGNHTLRCNMYLDHRTPSFIKDAMFARSYGLDNTILICRLLLEAGCPTKPNDNGSTPLRDLVEMMCSSYFGPDWAWSHSLEILEVGPLFDGYLDIITSLLEYGTDPNACPSSQLPPLLYLLSHIADSPYVDDYIIPQLTADKIQKYMQVLLEHGAHTEVEVKAVTAIGRVQTLGCFDMLTPILHQMQQHRGNHTSTNLHVLYTLALPLLQYGATTIVYHKVLYDVPTDSQAPWSYCMPTHSFLYQYLQFGLLNLVYVNDGHWYREMFEVLYSHTDHHTLQDVLNMIHHQLVETHSADNSCNCGQCHQYRDLLNEVTARPRSLKQMCRMSLSLAFGGKLAGKVPMLPLPQQIKEYLLSFRA